MVVAYVVAMGTAAVFFTCMPTEYPRPDLPTGPALNDAAYRWLVSIDTPLCCFPSAHILVPVLGCAGLWLDGRRGGFVLPLALAVCTLSILTTKQHYSWDWLGGLGVALLGMLVAALLLPATAREAASPADGARSAVVPEPQFLRNRRAKHGPHPRSQHPGSHVPP
jgi:hypothetical protein